MTANKLLDQFLDIKKSVLNSDKPQLILDETLSEFLTCIAHIEGANCPLVVQPFKDTNFVIVSKNEQTNFQTNVTNNGFLMKIRNKGLTIPKEILSCVDHEEDYPIYLIPIGPNHFVVKVIPPRNHDFLRLNPDYSGRYVICKTLLRDLGLTHTNLGDPYFITLNGNTGTSLLVRYATQ